MEVAETACLKIFGLENRRAHVLTIHPVIYFMFFTPGETVKAYVAVGSYNPADYPYGM
jgi:hypothetical protein